jgi:two-component system, chemotaxis family, sensor kinase CheA
MKADRLTRAQWLLMGVVGFYVLLVLSSMFFNTIRANKVRANEASIAALSAQLTGSERLVKQLLTLDALQQRGQDMSETLRDVKVSTRDLGLANEAMRTGGSLEWGNGSKAQLSSDKPALSAAISAFQRELENVLLKAQNIADSTAPSADSIHRAAVNATDNERRLASASDALGRALRESNSAGYPFSVRVLLYALGLTLIGTFLGAIWYLNREVNAFRQDAIARRAEARGILAAVGDGLFLMDRRYTIGEQHSEALEQVFGRSGFSGENFFNLIRSLVPEKVLNTAKDYLDLLFGDRVNEKLVQDLNPLDKVEFHFDNGHGGFNTKYLGMRFKRVFADGKVSHLLVTITDITKQISIEQELRESQERTQAQMDMLVELLHVEPKILSEFMLHAQTSLDQVNQMLREPTKAASDYHDKVVRMFRLVHAIKGEAGTIGLKSFQTAAHGIEEVLSELRARGSLTGNDFLALAVKLEDLFAQLDSVKLLLNRLGQLRAAILDRQPGAGITGERPAVGMPMSQAKTSLAATLEKLTEQISRKRGKQARFVAQNFELVPDEHLPILADILGQFVRNALVHGIERPDERTRAGKSVAGTLLTSASVNAQQQLEVLFRDDGRGIDINAIKQAAVRSGRMSVEQARASTDIQLMPLLFQPGFTTLAQADEDAGRGVGLDMVRAKLSAAQGHIRMGSATGKGAQFKITLPLTQVARGARA